MIIMVWDDDDDDHADELDFLKKRIIEIENRLKHPGKTKK
jgi:hypothetical protein